LFASRAGAAGTVLRWTMAGLVLFASVVRSFTVVTPGFVLPWLSGGVLPEGIVGGIALAIIGLLLLAGFFTRICAVVLLALMATSFAAVDFSNPNAGLPTEWILSACVCLTLAISGAGRLSIDRRISNFFLPTLS
jgi:uncharacterized membrane protein YphA (DoxX/SURF4 family)